MANITKEHALAIADKLDAKISPGSSHDLAQIYHQGKLIAWFGIRRGSKKDVGHGHIPDQLFIGPNKTRKLAQCTLKTEQWIEIMRKKGKLS